MATTVRHPANARDTLNAAAKFKTATKGAHIDLPLGDEQRQIARRGGWDDGFLTNGEKSGAFNVKTNDGSKACERRLSKRTLLPLLRNTVPTSPLASISAWR